MLSPSCFTETERGSMKLQYPPGPYPPKQQYPEIIRSHETKLPARVPPGSHFERVQREMQQLGVTKIARLFRRDALYLPKIIHENEKLTGVVYGRDQYGSVMMVATDRRVLHLSKRFLFANEDEIGYESVAGVSFSTSGFVSSVTLHARFADYRVRTYNRRSAEQFVRYIEERSVERGPDVGGQPERLTKP